MKKTIIKVTGENLKIKGTPITEREKHHFPIQQIQSFFIKDNTLSLQTQGEGMLSDRTEWCHYENWQKYETFMNGVKIGEILNPTYEDGKEKHNP